MRSPALTLAVLAGAACVALSGPLGVAAAVLVAAGFVARPFAARVGDWSFAHILGIFLCGAVAFTTGVIPAFSLLLGWLTAHRAATARDATDERVLLLLATLMALIGAVGTVSLGLAPALGAFALAAPVALLRASGLRDRLLSLGASVATGLLTLTFFLLVPRMQGGLMASAGGEAGRDRFADTVQLGDELDDPDADALIARVRLYSREGVPLDQPVYLRGRTLDHFDGRAWSASGTVRRIPTGMWDQRAEVMLEPLEGATVYGPPDMLYARSEQGPILLGPDGELDHSLPGRRVEYEVFSRSRPLEQIDDGPDGLLQLPALDPRVAALAAAIAPEGASRDQIVAGAVRYLAGFTYDVHPPTPEGDPLGWFLFESKTGHCEYFATALAVLLRERGVPARLATGFYSAEVGGEGGYTAVRRGHAHAWVEVAVHGGWSTVDATPVGGLPDVQVSWWQSLEERTNEAWLSLVLDYDLDAQIEGAAALGRPLVSPLPGDPVRERGRAGFAGALLIFGALTLSGSVVRLGLWWLSRPRRQGVSSDALLRAFAAARRRVVARGWAIPAALPPVEAGEWLLREAGPDGAPLLALAWAVYRARYGDAEVPAEELRRLASAARAIPGRRRDPG